MEYDVKILSQAYEFIQTVPVKMRAKIFRTVGLLETFGYQLSEPHAKSVTGYPGLNELRVKLASDICRLFYFHFKGNLYVLTSGYVKKDSKLDILEIKRALRLMNAFKNGEIK